MKQKEIQTILQNCKQTLKLSQDENTQLKDKLQQEQDQQSKITKHTVALQKEERLLRRDNEEWQFQLEEKSKVLQLIKEVSQIIDDNDHSFEYDLHQHPQYSKISQLQEQHRHAGQDLLGKIVKLENSMDRLKLLNTEIQKESQFLKDSSAFWTCARCNVVQKEGHNDESCVYHPGRLKYFSCRSCGADEYFTCCNMCRICSPGCHTGLHKP
ncbi:hypothetical protein pb186bvf_008335 [Paramecium bursaria]